MAFALPKKTRILWQMRALFILVLAYTLVVVFCRTFSSILIPTTVAFAVGSVFILFYISFYLKNYKIKISNGVVYIKKGVIFKTSLIIPFPKLAIVKTFSTIVTSCLKLEIIVFKVARGYIILPEMDCSSAKRLLMAVHYE